MKVFFKPGPLSRRGLPVGGREMGKRTLPRSSSSWPEPLIQEPPNFCRGFHSSGSLWLKQQQLGVPFSTPPHPTGGVWLSLCGVERQPESRECLL